MKNISLILNGVLLVAVVILYVLHFTGGKGDAGETGGAGPGELGIALVNADTILKYYEYLQAMQTELEAKYQKRDRDYNNRAQDLQEQYESYRRNVNNMTIGQVRSTEEELAKKEQNLRMYQQSLTQELMAEQEKLNRELYGRVTAFLRKYGHEKGLHIVLKFDPTSDVLFAGDSLDITSEVLAGLNREYQAERKQPAGARPDSTAGRK